MHVAYLQKGRELLVIAAPADCLSADELIMTLDNCCRVLCFSHGSLHGSVTNTVYTSVILCEVSYVYSHRCDIVTCIELSSPSYRCNI